MPRNKNKKIKNSLFSRSINKQFLLTKEELRKIAEQKNKSLEEIINEYRHALKELEYSKNRLHKIIKDFGYKKFSNTLYLYSYGKHGELKLKYLCYDNLKIFNKIPKDEIAIVKGFWSYSCINMIYYLTKLIAFPSKNFLIFSIVIIKIFSIASFELKAL
jgi:hypothetical protein